MFCLSEVRKKLDELYRATDYESSQAGVTLRAGQPSEAMLRLTSSFQEKGYAFITAWNPGSEPVSSAWNRKQNSLLEEQLTRKRYIYFEGKGIPHTEGWNPEESFLILGITKEDAIALGREFSQNAILYGSGGNAPELLFIDDYPRTQ